MQGTPPWPHLVGNWLLYGLQVLPSQQPVAQLAAPQRRPALHTWLTHSLVEAVLVQFWQVMPPLPQM